MFIFEFRHQRYPDKFKNGILCAGLRNLGNRDACSGDFGVPLVLKNVDGVF